jgi:uncharacterized membrane protein
MNEIPRMAQRRGPNWLRIVLIIPFIATLWVPFYNQMNPRVFGVPFFYWYQMLWVPLSALLILVVFRTES